MLQEAVSTAEEINKNHALMKESFQEKFALSLFRVSSQAFRQEKMLGEASQEAMHLTQELNQTVLAYEEKCV